MFEIEPYNPGRSKFWRLRNDARAQPQPWRWPLARLGDRDPIVLAEGVNGDRLAADLGYEARPFDRELYVPVQATQDGEVVMATETTSGFFVSIEHGYRSLTTTYARMSQMFVTPYFGQVNRRRQRVRCGDVVGYAAKSPIAVRFEVWRWTETGGYSAIDPVAQLTEWFSPLTHPMPCHHRPLREPLSPRSPGTRGPPFQEEPCRSPPEGAAIEVMEAGHSGGPERPTSAGYEGLDDRDLGRCGLRPEAVWRCVGRTAVSLGLWAAAKAAVPARASHARCATRRLSPACPDTGHNVRLPDSHRNRRRGCSLILMYHSAKGVAQERH